MITIDAALLRQWALPLPDDEGDKEDRGRVLCIGGALELPGAIALAGTAALRAGAGKLQIATCRAIALSVGVAVPEARVFSLAQSAQGGIAASAAPALAKWASRAQAVLLGPGMLDDDAIQQLMRRLIPRLAETDAVLILDAGALVCAAACADALRSRGGRVVLTPHAGEMCSLLGIERTELDADPHGVAQRAADRFGAVVALKGAQTLIVTPHGESYVYREGTVGLATSGSGDTLAGIVAGLAARGAPPAQAACWGVFLHGSAGNRLARRMGLLGFLARELLAEVPPLMAEMAGEAAFRTTDVASAK